MLELPTIVLFAAMGLLIFFMFRNGAKRRAMQAELLEKAVPGSEIMTSFGLFGTLKSVDELGNTAELEVSPGVVVRILRPAIAQVLNGEDSGPRSVEEAMAIAEREAAEREAASKAADGEPQYGERIGPEKPARRKKSSE